MAIAYALAAKQKSVVCYSHLQAAFDVCKKFITEYNGGVEVNKIFM
jgi:hypothetical protein